MKKNPHHHQPASQPKTTAHRLVQIPDRDDQTTRCPLTSCPTVSGPSRQPSSTVQTRGSATRTRETQLARALKRPNHKINLGPFLSLPFPVVAERSLVPLRLSPTGTSA